MAKVMKGRSEPLKALRLEIRRRAQAAAEAAGKDWSQLSKEERKSFRQQAVPKEERVALRKQARKETASR